MRQKKKKASTEVKLQEIMTLIFCVYLASLSSLPTTLPAATT